MVLSAQPALNSSIVSYLKPQISAGEGFQETPFNVEQGLQKNQVLPGHMVEAAPNASNEFWERPPQPLPLHLVPWEMAVGGDGTTSYSHLIWTLDTAKP